MIREIKHVFNINNFAKFRENFFKFGGNFFALFSAKNLATKNCANFFVNIFFLSISRNKACITDLLETLDTITDMVNKVYAVDLDFGRGQFVGEMGESEVTSLVYHRFRYLGQLRFTIFINDLSENVKNMCKLYADDCKLIGIVRNEDN